MNGEKLTPITNNQSMGTQSTAGISMPVSGDFHLCKGLL